MILLHLLAKNGKQAKDISNFLLQRKFVSDTFIVAGSMHAIGVDEDIVEDSRVLVIGKTRALLFDKIDKEVIKEFSSDPPLIYSLPIVNMDWDQASELTQSITINSED